MITGTVGTTPATVLTQFKAGQYLRVHNPNGSSGAFLAVTYDGATTPVIYGAGVTIAPLDADSWDVFVSNGAVQLVSDQAGGAAYTILYTPQS